MSRKRQVVITGVGVASPVGDSVAELYQAVWSGVGRFVELGDGQVQTSVRYVGACASPDPKKLPDRKVQKILRRKDVIGLVTLLEAARHAGVQKGTFDPDRTGMYVGASSTQIADLEPYYELVKECVDIGAKSFDAARFGSKLMGAVNPLVVLQTLMNNSLCFGAMTLDIRGVNANFMDFHAAGLRAVGEGWLSIVTGRADQIVAGGVSTSVEPFQMQEGVASGYLAKTRGRQEPATAMVRPYDRDRYGTILSEGSAFVILEEEEGARRRGANVLARLDGFALAGDGAIDIMGAHASPGIGRAAREAMRHAGVAAEDLGLIVGHGSGSVHDDRAEAEAVLGLLGKQADRIPLTSPKAVLGDMCEAGGVASLLVAIESLKRREAPPTANFSAGDDFSGRLALRASCQSVTKERALVTARSFLGGSAAVVISI